MQKASSNRLAGRSPKPTAPAQEVGVLCYRAGPAAFRFSLPGRAMAENIPMTRAGAEAIKRELKRLKSVERPKNVHEIAVARDHGDLRENAEYHAAKERQSHIEGRIQMLEDRLARAEIIDVTRLSGDRVVFGATVKLEDTDSGAKAQMSSILKDSGWETLDAGGIGSAGYLEAMFMVWLLTGAPGNSWNQAFKMLR